MEKLYCPCENEQPDPCPLCGATVSGNDPRNGVCRYPDPPPTDYGIRLVLVDRRTGEIVENPRMPKSLFEYIAEAIDEALPPDSGISGREIYLRGFERFEQESFDRAMAQKKRELDRQYPLLATLDECVEV